jgi:hypothetical protein
MPDLDAITAVWLIKKFLPEWHNAAVVYVNAGATLDKAPPDSNPDIIHVDTGSGMFDHHQTAVATCAARLVLDYLVKKNAVDVRLSPALYRLCEFVTIIDQFGESHFPDAPSDTYDFCLHQIANGLNHTLRDSNTIITIMSANLEAALQIMRNKIRAETEVQKGKKLNSVWGKTLAMETRNEEAVKLAMKMGYELVIRRDPEKGGYRIKSLPSEKSDLSRLYEKITAVDSVGKWYLHQSKNILLNSSSINPDLTPSPLNFEELIEIITSVQ